MTSAPIANLRNNYSLPWALALSILLHAVLVSFLHPFRFDAPAVKPPLEIELQQPEPPPPEPIKPEPPPKPEPKPEPKPLPKKPLPEPPPVRVPEPTPATPVSETPPPPPPPEVITAAPKAAVEEPPAFIVPPPPPEPPKHIGPTQQEIDAARGAYGSRLANEFAKHKQYPRIAQMRGWQGTVRVELLMNADGEITAPPRIVESSGFDVLDKQALEMARKALPLPHPPEVLRGRDITIIVPIPFILK
jgi:protein TonB